jgi:hypothetical protein
LRFGYVIRFVLITTFSFLFCQRFSNEYLAVKELGRTERYWAIPWEFKSKRINYTFYNDITPFQSGSLIILMLRCVGINCLGFLRCVLNVSETPVQQPYRTLFQVACPLGMFYFKEHLVRFLTVHLDGTY